MSSIHQINFKRSGRDGYLNGMLTEPGISGMLEGSDQGVVNKVFFFPGTPAHKRCGANETPQMTRAYTLYVDVVDFIPCKYVDPGLSRKELNEISEKLQKIKSTAYEIFSAYYASKMGTPKWHALDHVCSAIREYGDFVHPSARLFENSHKTF